MAKPQALPASIDASRRRPIELTVHKATLRRITKESDACAMSSGVAKRAIGRALYVAVGVGRHPARNRPSCLDPSRTNGVAAHAASSPFRGECSGQSNQTVLGRVVGRGRRSDRPATDATLMMRPTAAEHDRQKRGQQRNGPRRLMSITRLHSAAVISSPE